jgi:hypothetical protein
LRPVPAEQRQWLETERVADSPETELRILARPSAEPVLAEVVFPPTMSIGAAKEYIFKELQELPVQAAAGSLRWAEDGDRLVLRLSETPLADVQAVDLAPGVRELVGAVRQGDAGPQQNRGGWRTCCLEFDGRAGWGREQAEEWLQLHLGCRDLGRTARLEVPHRMTPELARAVQAILHDDAPPITPADAAVTFIAVPRDGGRSARGPSRGGAGFEIDLHDSRPGDHRLPADLKSQLPGRGLVNLAEAQAIVQHLATFATDASSLLPVAVVALYPAQAELIRRLLADRREPLSGLAVEVGVPESFRERDFPVVLLSLTRSHTHRAVSFGDDPGQLALALTRARRQLVMFGDPGTLLRRTQWDGPLDHLDARAAARERRVINRLLRLHQNRGPRPRSSRSGEGSGP